MARREDLEFKVRALVEGVREVEELEREINDLHQEARQEVPDTTGRFRRGLRQAGDAAGRAGRQIFNLRNAMVAAASVTAAGAIIQRSVAATAALDEQADTAGVNVERFQELTKAFSDMAGVAEDVTSGALRRFNRRIGLARQGTGAAANTVERLNIDLEQGTGPALDEAIEKLAAMDDGADRAAAASQLFGEDAGPRLAAALSQGQDALDETIAKLQEQGRIMSGEAVDGARDLNDRLNEISDTISTRFNEAIARNAEEIETLGEAIANAGSAAVNFGGDLVNFVEWLGEEAAAAIHGVSEGDLVRLDARLGEVQETLSRLREAPTQFRNDARIQALEIEEERLRGLIELERERRAQAAADDVIAPDRRFNQAELQAQLDFLSRSPGDGRSDDTRDRDLSGIGEIQFDDSTALEITRELEENLRSLEDQSEDTSDAIDHIGEIQFDDSTALEITRELEQNLADLEEQSEETAAQLSEFAKSAQRNMQTALADEIFDGFEDGLEGMEEAFERTMRRIAAEAASAQIMESLFGEGGSGIAQVFGGGSGGDGGFIGTAANFIAGLFHSGGVVGEGGQSRAVSPLAFAGAPRMHSGGIAGMRRDEMPAILKRGEEVLPADSPRHRDNAGGGDMTVIQNIQTPDAQSFRRSRSAVRRDMQLGLRGSNR